MKRYNVIRNGKTTNSWTEDYAGADYYEPGFGLPERIINADEPHDVEDVVEEIPAVMDGETEVEPAKVKLRAEYVVEVLDLGNSQVLAQLRSQRDLLLANCDWTQMADSPLSSEVKLAWAEYRQALRDLPDNNSNIEALEEVSWPTKP